MGRVGSGILKNILNANSVLYAITDNVPAALSLAASRILGRKSSGNIAAMTAAELLTIINVAAGADVTGSNAPAGHLASHQDTGGDEISVAALSGLLADDQHVLDSEVTNVAIAKTLMTTRGDTIFRNATVPARLAKGSDGDVLTMGADDPAWTAPAGGAILTVGDAGVFSGTSPTSWTDLNLSGTVGSQSTLIVLKIEYTAGTKRVAFRRNGDTNEFYTETDVPLGAACGEVNGGKYGVFIVFTDTSGVIEWRTETAVTMTMDVMGYIK